MNALCIHVVYVLSVFCTKVNSEDNVQEHSKHSSNYSSFCFLKEWV